MAQCWASSFLTLTVAVQVECLAMQQVLKHSTAAATIPSAPSEGSRWLPRREAVHVLVINAAHCQGAASRTAT